mmetsp:Transcript_50620/g.100743  ORF Transcript_50620/g.100743 Transcript_50620/m.100743 type:complete len:87 (+) Transcript_50620:148-408(+)
MTYNRNPCYVHTNLQQQQLCVAASPQLAHVKLEQLCFSPTLVEGLFAFSFATGPLLFHSRARFVGLSKLASPTISPHLLKSLPPTL